MFTIYSKPSCAFCDQAKSLLDSRGLQYSELILDVGQEKKEGKNYVTLNQLLSVVPNAKTVPQILKNGELIGGFGALKHELSTMG